MNTQYQTAMLHAQASRSANQPLRISEQAPAENHRAAATISTSTLKSGRVNPVTIIKVDAGGGDAT